MFTFKRGVISLMLLSSVAAQNFIEDFFKYSTAYASFSLNAPRYQDDRFAIIGGLSTGDLVFERTEREFNLIFRNLLVLEKLVDLSMNLKEVLEMPVKVENGTMVQNKMQTKWQQSDQ